MAHARRRTAHCVFVRKAVLVAIVSQISRWLVGLPRRYTQSYLVCMCAQLGAFLLLKLAWRYNNFFSYFWRQHYYARTSCVGMPNSHYRRCQVSAKQWSDRLQRNYSGLQRSDNNRGFGWSRWRFYGGCVDWYAMVRSRTTKTSEGHRQWLWF